MFFTVSTLHTKRHYRIWLISSPFSFAVTQQKITPYRKTTHLISVFLTRSKRIRFYYIYISASNKQKNNK